MTKHFYILFIILLSSILLVHSLINVDDCKITKSCFFGAQKTTIATWYLVQPANLFVHFELQTKIDHDSSNVFVALGLSHDDFMTNTAVTACITDSVEVGMGLWLNSGHDSNTISNVKTVGPNVIKNVTKSVEDGSIYCSYDQLINLPTGTQMRTLNETYTLILVTGRGVYSTDAFESAGAGHSCGAECKPTFMHNVNPSNASFQSGSGTKNNTSVLLRHIHGIIMIIAWCVCHATAILSARFFKGMYPKHKPTNKEIWFHSHRGLNVIGLLLVITATLLIVVSEKSWVGNLPYPIGYHASVGVATIVSSSIQPIGAMFRPHPGDKNRWIFNHFHRTLGLSSYLLAGATTWLATEMESIISEDIRGVMKLVLYIYWGVVVTAFILLEVHITLTQRLKSTSAQDDALSGVTPPSINNIKMAHIRTGILLVFILSALALVITMIVYIVQNMKQFL